jgi:membrane protease YdiL (CAAX protease family)
MVWRNGLSLPALFGRCPATIRDGALILGAVAGVYLLGRFEWSVLIPALETHAPALADLYRASSTDGASIPLSRIVLAVVVAPVVEEVVFRGVIYSRCARYWESPVLAMLISSLLFTMLHGHILSSFIFGIVAVCLYTGTGSLWTPIGFHAALNGIAATGWSVQDPVTAWTALSDLAFGWTCLTLSVAILAALLRATRPTFFQPLPYIRDT